MRGRFHSRLGFTVAGHTELMHDVLGHFAGGTLFAIQKNVGLAVEGFAFMEQLFDFCERIGAAQEGAMGLVADAGENRFGRGPKTDDQRMRFEALHVFGIHDEAAAGGDDAVALGFEFLDDGGFEGAEMSFAFVGEDIRDAFASALFDDVISIDQTPM